MRGEGGLITGPKKRFKTSYIAVLVKYYSFQYKLEVGGGAYIRGVYSGGSRGGARAHRLKECSIWYPGTLKLPCFWASSKFEK